MWFGKSNEKNLEELRDIEDDVEESDYVPYACLYNEHTILTKNGELFQTIKIIGTVGELSAGDLRTALRRAVKAHIPNDSFAIWLHTIRREVSMSAEGTYTIPLAKKLNDEWVRHNRFDKQYINEVYLSVAIEGQEAELLNPTVFARGLLPKLDLKWRFDYIDRIHAQLSDVVQKLLKDLSPYGARLLGMHEEGDVYYSEQLRFLEKVINLVDRPMPVPMEDLSTYLTSGDVTFSYNAMEVRTAEGRRRFGSLITLKEYKEASLAAIDKFLLLPVEFVITQCVYFVNPKRALANYKNQQYFLTLGEADELAKLSEVERILKGDRGKPNDFGEQQLSIFLLADTVRELEASVKHAVQFLAEHGLVTIREDIKLEECYWAQLPGNFVFVTRMAPTDMLHIGGFTNVTRIGADEDGASPWGMPISTFHAAAGAPFFFHFHTGASGHTLMLGPESEPQLLLQHFLMAQATKVTQKMYYFGVESSAEPFIRALGGTYQRAELLGEHAVFNPFILSDTEKNQLFLTRLCFVMAKAAGNDFDAEDRKAAQTAIAALYAKSEKERNFATFMQLLGELSLKTASSLAIWSGSGRLAHLFGKRQVESLAAIHAFDISTLEEQPLAFAAVASFLLQAVTDRLDGAPSLIVLGDAWRTLRMTHLSDNLGAWLAHLTQKNAVCLLANGNSETAAQDPLTMQAVEHTVTQLLLPDPQPNPEVMQLLRMNELEFSYLKAMDAEEGHFMLRQHGQFSVAALSPEKLPSTYPLLTGDVKSDTVSYAEPLSA